MGGVASGNFSTETTHLIATSCEPTPKYKAAIENGVVVIFPSWVDEFYDKAIQCDIHDEPDGTKYVIPIFHNCVITCSGFDPGVRLTICNLIENNGGEFTTDMVHQTCTHLIINSNTGKKYNTARTWGDIKIVTDKWLLKCIQKVWCFSSLFMINLKYLAVLIA